MLAPVRYSTSTRKWLLHTKNGKLTRQTLKLALDRAHGVGGDHVDQQIVRREGKFSQSFGDSGHKRPVRSQGAVVIKHQVANLKRGLAGYGIERHCCLH